MTSAWLAVKWLMTMAIMGRAQHMGPQGDLVHRAVATYTRQYTGAEGHERASLPKMTIWYDSQLHSHGTYDSGLTEGDAGSLSNTMHLSVLSEDAFCVCA